MLHERNVLAQRTRDPRAPGPSLPGLGPRVVVTSCQGAGPRCELAGSLLAFQEIKSVDDFFFYLKSANLHRFLNLLWMPQRRNAGHLWWVCYLTAADEASVHKVPGKVTID